jgi:PTH1 family peptidyl-tRNA hydrolase
MKIILGLGNPGVEYANTRHNAGILLVDNFSQRLSSSYGWRREKNKFIFKTDKFMLVKTASVFMNESGSITPSGQFYLVHDDLDIRLGEFKIQMGKGPKVHNGVESVENALKTKDFWRIRIGIDNRTTPVDGETYVLQKFSSEERKILDGVFESIIKVVIP